MVEYYPTNTHVGAYVWFAKKIEHKLILKKMMTCDLKGHGLCQLWNILT
jgi:hypothetical protein